MKTEKIASGGQPKYHEKLKEQNKIICPGPLQQLFDNGKYEEDGMFANNSAEDLPADGVVTAIGESEWSNNMCHGK